MNHLVRESLTAFASVQGRAQDDPMKLAYIPSAPTRASVAFDLVTSAANVFGGVWETGAGAIFAENEALAWLVELLGWPRTAGGCFVSGGTSGNLSALVAAREAALARRGSRPAQGWQLVCTSEVHSSIRSTARVLDVTIVEVPGDEKGRLTGARLEPILRTHPDVFAVVATAGTTNAGLIDDLAGIADACTAHGVWMHVDGAYGGQAWRH
jgi:glutamate/tyrosine decarboxylase-like PLP-dependent enzyme